MIKYILCSIAFSLCLSFSLAQHWEEVGGGVDPRYIYGLYEWNNKLAVCGGFGTICGTSMNSVGVGWWSGSAWTAETADFSNTPPAKCFIEYENELYIAGGFTKISGNKYCNKIARLDSAGYWSPLGSGVTGGTEIRCMAVYNGDLYVGGQFGIVDSTVLASKIARWDGTSWHAIGSGIQGSFGVNDMTVFQNQLYVGGFFSSANGVQTLGIGRWNGTNWDSLGTGLNGPANTLFADTINNRLYVGGQFTIAGGVSTPTGVAYWDGSNWFPVGTNPYIPPWDLIIHNGILYNTSTQYYAVNSLGDTIEYIAWYDGVNWKPVPGGLSSSGLCLYEFQNELYVGGVMQYAGDSLVNGIAKWIPGSLGQSEIQLENLQLLIRPNPAKEEVILEMELNKPTNLKVQITDLGGRNVKMEELFSNGKLIHHIDVSNLGDGVYLFSVFENLQLLGTTKVIISN